MSGDDSVKADRVGPQIQSWPGIGKHRIIAVMIRMLKIHEQRQLGRTIGLSWVFLAAPFFIWPTELYSQARRHVKVLLESQQFGNLDRGSVQGSGSVIIRRDSVRPSGRLGAVEKETKVQ